jgi:hypothetical protein
MLARGWDLSERENQSSNSMKRVRKPVLRSLFMLSFSAMPALPGWQQAMAATYPATILADNPVAYYRLEETSGTTAFDSSGHLFDATYTPNSSSVYPTLGLPGITTNSVGFHGGTSGNADHVLIPFHPELSPALPDGQHGAPFSAECWVMSTTHPADYAVPLSMFGSYADPPPFNNASGWNFYQTGPPSGGTSFWVLNMKNGAFLSAATVPIALLQWYHLAVTFDGSTVTFYVNGVSRGTTSGITGYFANPSHNGQIGAGANTGFLPFTGNVDEVAFYTNALSLAQVQSHYQTGTNSFRAPPTPPAFVQQPVSTTNFAGTTASFSAVVSGTAPLYYQWKRGGVRISGATNSVYSLLATYPADDGATFSLTVTNSVGTNNSDVVTLTVLTNLDVLYPPFSITRNVGSKAAFRTVATGAIPLGYQWYKISGVVTSVIPGATNDILWLNSVQLADDQSQYFARITNAFTSVDSDAATLTVQARPVTVPITGYAKVIAADSPVALLRLDEGTGSLKAVDAFGSFDGNLLDKCRPVFRTKPTPHWRFPAARWFLFRMPSRSILQAIGRRKRG